MVGRRGPDRVTHGLTALEGPIANGGRRARKDAGASSRSQDFPDGGGIQALDFLLSAHATPFVPQRDAQVLERLPAVVNPEARELRSLRLQAVPGKHCGSPRPIGPYSVLRDGWVLLEAAIAMKDPAAARPVLEFLAGAWSDDAPSRLARRLRVAR